MRPQKRMRVGTINWYLFFIWPKNGVVAILATARPCWKQIQRQ